MGVKIDEFFEYRRWNFGNLNFISKVGVKEIVDEFLEYPFQ